MCFNTWDTDAVVINFVSKKKKVMLLGHSDSYTRDKQMQVTIAYNHFGEGLIQRMPRYYYLSLSTFHFSENDFLMYDRFQAAGTTGA